jgi:hypothetical protein
MLATRDYDGRTIGWYEEPQKKVIALKPEDYWKRCGAISIRTG